MVMLGISTPSLLLGQSKFALQPRYSYGGARHSGGYIRNVRPSSAGSRVASDTVKTNALRNDLIKWATVGGIMSGAMGLGGYLSGVGSTIGSYSTSLAPQERYGGRSYQEEGSRQFGSGLMTGYGEQFIPNIQRSSAEQARLYQEYSPVYQDVAVQKVWAEQQARYEANKAYPTFPTQKTSDMKAPYNVEIL